MMTVRHDSEIVLLGGQPALDRRPTEKRVGLITLATDHTTEPDFWRMVASARIAVYVSRIPYANPTTPENLLKMHSVLVAGAQLILPGEDLDAICYSCTSASVVIGEEKISDAIHEAKPGVPVITPTDAAIRGLTALGKRRISILTPYSVETTRPVARYFADRGFAIESVACLGFEDDREMARIAPSAWVDLARGAVTPTAEALFISCTAVRAAAVVHAIETAVGRPVVTSNLATAWMCLRLCRDHDPRPHWGRLMTVPLATA